MGQHGGRQASLFSLVRRGLLHGAIGPKAFTLTPSGRKALQLLARLLLAAALIAFALSIPAAGAALDKARHHHRL